MEAGGEPSHGVRGDGGVGRASAVMLTPPSSSTGVDSSPEASTGHGLASGEVPTPGAGSDSTGRDSVPTTRREFKRVKERLVHFNEHIRQQLKDAANALKKEKEEREAQLPLLSKLVGDRTNTMTEVVGVELQEMKRSIQESLDNMQAKLAALEEKIEEWR